MKLATRHSREKTAGFSLVELLVVIVIIGILAMIIVPQLSTSTDEAKLSTLQSDLSAMRSAVEVYRAQHNAYPAEVMPTNPPAGVSSLADAFVAQMTRYTDAGGRISNTKDATFKYGPYLKGNNLPMNPFNDKEDVTIDASEADITVRNSSGAGTAWKFYAKTGVFMSADGAHDSL